MNKTKILFILVITSISTPVLTYASEIDGPWVEAFNTILGSLTGPFLRFAIITAIVIAGLKIAFGTSQDGIMQHMFRVILGLSLAAGSTYGLELFNFTGGLLF
jgi:type IV secretory pathway VirB2 component (pilin)